MSTLMLAANPRKRRRHSRRKHRVHFRGIMRNPRRSVASRSSGGLSSGLSNSPVLGMVIPVGAGVVAGLALPKFFTFTQTWQKIGAQVILGLGVPMLIKGFVGRKTAVLFGAGVLSAVVIQLVDQMLLSKQGKNVLSNDEFSAESVDVINDNVGADAENFNDDEMNDDEMNDDEMNDED
jgi:hypothetical protein